jgi:hypothetical protein
VIRDPDPDADFKKKEINKSRGIPQDAFFGIDMEGRLTTVPTEEAPIDVQPTIMEPRPAPTKRSAAKGIRTAVTRSASAATMRASTRRMLEYALAATAEVIEQNRLPGSPPRRSRSRSPPARTETAPASPRTPAALRIVNVYSPVPPMSPAECDAFIAFYTNQKAVLQAQADATIIIVSSTESTPDHVEHGSSEPE